MIGHDPQRTNRGESRGPGHPHLLFTSALISGPALIGPDGSLYGWGRAGLQALYPDGHSRWSVPAQPIEGGDPALAPNGLLVVNGLVISGSGATQKGGMAVLAISRAGQQRWAIHALPWAAGINGTFYTPTGQPIAMGQSVPLSKGVSPVVTAANTLFMPFVGPGAHNAGLEMIGPAGALLRRLQPEFPPLAFAVASRGSLYVLGGDGPPLTLVALGPTGKTLWTQKVTGENAGSVLIGRQGMIYASVGNNTSGEVVANTSVGHLLWRRTVLGRAVLAERADGMLLIATNMQLSAVRPDGMLQWQITLSKQRQDTISLPSIAVDAAGTAFVGSTDGVVRAISTQGRVLWTLRAGGPGTTAPACSLGVGGKLVIVGTDGLLREYS